MVKTVWATSIFSKLVKGTGDTLLAEAVAIAHPPWAHAQALPVLVECTDFETENRNVQTREYVQAIVSALWRSEGSISAGRIPECQFFCN